MAGEGQEGVGPGQETTVTPDATKKATLKGILEQADANKGKGSLWSKIKEAKAKPPTTSEEKKTETEEDRKARLRALLESESKGSLWDQLKPGGNLQERPEPLSRGTKEPEPNPSPK